MSREGEGFRIAEAHRELLRMVWSIDFHGICVWGVARSQNRFHNRRSRRRRALETRTVIGQTLNLVHNSGSVLLASDEGFWVEKTDR